MKEYDVIIIGAGASGLIASGTIAQNGKSVLLLDKNQKVGRKIIITGKGRCNVTNNCDNDRFFSAVRRNSRFMFSSFNNFNSQDTMEFFTKQGVELKTERGNRVFPLSDKSVDIVDALYNFIKKNNVDFKQSKVIDVDKKDNRFIVKCLDDSIYSSEFLLICTGGLSYPATGSTGDGYNFAKKFGHNVLKQSPSIVPIELKEDFCQSLMGLSLKNVTLSVFEDKKKIYSDIGEMMFTHFGISGPLVLTASSYLGDDLSKNSLEIDFKPGLTNEMLDKRLLRDFNEMSNKSISNVLIKLLPRSIIKYVLIMAHIPQNKIINEITKEERNSLIRAVKGFKLTPKSLRSVTEAVVTRGGVDTKEINPKTMESKLVENLFFAGEVIDVDAVTGGFNLQIAFSTGISASKGIIEK